MASKITRATAGLRWPGYRIEGEGTVACVLECCLTVRLVQTPMEANMVTSERCCAGCSHVHAPYAGFHKQRNLDAPAVQARYDGRLAALMED